MVVKKKNDFSLGDISNLHFGVQDNVIYKYLNSLLSGDLAQLLEDNNSKVFKGISREYTKKYMIQFNEILKFNDYTTGPLEKPLKIEYNGDEAYEYYAFFVFQQGKGNAFGSFPAAYKYANEQYIFLHMILGNATKVLAKNTDVEFGHVIVQNGKMAKKDVQSVVNKDFYKILIPTIDID